MGSFLHLFLLEVDNIRAKLIGTDLKTRFAIKSEAHVDEKSGTILFTPLDFLKPLLRTPFN